MKSTVALYKPSHYAHSGFASLQKKCGLTPAEAQMQAAKTREELEKEGFSLRTITTYMLDNPYMEDDARVVMMNAAMRYRESQGRRRVGA